MSEVENAVETGAAPEAVVTSEPAQETKGAGGLTAETAPEGYTPNYSFKVMNEQKEFDEWAKKVVKDAETEKAVRELYEKAHGLDFVKQDRVKLKEEYQTVAKDYEGLKGHLLSAGQARQRGDYKTFFESFGVSDEEILKYALKVAELREAGPEAQAKFEAQRQESLRATQLEQENQTMYQQVQSLGVQQRTFELDQALASPEVSQVAQMYDERVGQPGAFRAEVVRRGQYHWYQSQKDLPAMQVAKEVASLFGPLQSPQASQPQATAPSPVVAAKKPVIPNIQGRGTSPAQKLPKSIDDLKKLRDEMRA